MGIDVIILICNILFLQHFKSQRILTKKKSSILEEFTSFWRPPCRLGLPFSYTFHCYDISVMICLFLVGYYTSNIHLVMSPILPNQRAFQVDSNLFTLGMVLSYPLKLYIIYLGMLDEIVKPLLCLDKLLPQVRLLRLVGALSCFLRQVTIE